MANPATMVFNVGWHCLWAVVLLSCSDSIGKCGRLWEYLIIRCLWAFVPESKSWERFRAFASMIEAVCQLCVAYQMHFSPTPCVDFWKSHHPVLMFYFYALLSWTIFDVAMAIKGLQCSAVFTAQKKNDDNAPQHAATQDGEDPNLNAMLGVPSSTTTGSF